MDNASFIKNEDGTFGDKSHQVVLYRHATSNANIKFQNRESMTKEQFRELDWSETERDSEIADVGVELAESKQPIFNSMNIHTVFVSPMRRALQTAYHSFKTHPRYDDIKFVILPKARESINFAAGIPTNIDVVVSEFKELIPNLDDSELDKYSDRLHYFIEDTDSHRYDEIMQEKQYKESDPIKSNVFDLIVDKAEKARPKDFESKLGVLKRANLVKQYISEYIKNISSDEKVVLVTHYFLLENWTGQWHESMYNEDKSDIRKPDVYFHFHNCDIFYSPIDIVTAEDSMEIE